VEIVNFCVSGFGMIERPAIPKLAAARDSKPPRDSRPVYFAGSHHDTPVYDRSQLPSGLGFDGPAVIEEFGSTTVIFPGQRVDIDPHGILIVRRLHETAGGSR
jgi:N-methylhydantoinase A